MSTDPRWTDDDELLVSTALGYGLAEVANTSVVWDDFVRTLTRAVLSTLADEGRLNPPERP